MFAPSSSLARLRVFHAAASVYIPHVRLSSNQVRVQGNKKAPILSTDDELLQMVEKPKEIGTKALVEYLDRAVIGQADAKKAVAMAYRNRWRHRHVDAKLRSNPKNLLMVGPTGSGKTEIARQLARFLEIPFYKCEATSLSQIGYVGADVKDIVRGALNASFELQKRKIERIHEDHIDKIVEEEIIGELAGKHLLDRSNQDIATMYRDGELDDIQLDMPPRAGGYRKDVGPLSVRAWKMIIRSTEMQARTPKEDTVMRAAKEDLEMNGIIFIDEIDKLVGDTYSLDGRPSVSNEGVQRDLLPIVEGTKCEVVLSEKQYVIDTSGILFIAAGAFHNTSVRDFLPELQGRFPIIAPLHELDEAQLYGVLADTEHGVIEQTKALMLTENVELDFEDEALREIANVSVKLNNLEYNTGVRRLLSVVEHVMSDISMDAEDIGRDEINQATGRAHVTVTKQLVNEKTDHLLRIENLDKHLL